MHVARVQTVHRPYDSRDSTLTANTVTYGGSGGAVAAGARSVFTPTITTTFT